VEFLSAAQETFALQFVNASNVTMAVSDGYFKHRININVTDTTVKKLTIKITGKLVSKLSTARFILYWLSSSCSCLVRLASRSNRHSCCISGSATLQHATRGEDRSFTETMRIRGRDVPCFHR
jgi:hypothetical protein